MADDAAAAQSLHDIISNQLKKETTLGNPDFDTALLKFHEFKAQVDDFVAKVSKLDEETKHLTFGRDEDYEAFHQAVVTVDAYGKKYLKLLVRVEMFFRNGDSGDWFRCQLEGCRIFLRDRFINKICEARGKRYGEGDAMKKWAELPLGSRPRLPYWGVVKDD